MNSSISTDRTMTRRESVWGACNQLAEQNKKPSVARIRSLYNSGSATDVQADINAWYKRLFEGYCAANSGRGMPDEVFELARQFWETATASAHGHLSHERNQLALERQQLTDEHAAYVKMYEEQQRLLENLQRELATCKAEKAVVQEKLQKANQTCDSLLGEQNVFQQRLRGMQQEIDAQSRRHSETVQLMSIQHQEALAGFNVTAAQSEQQLRGMEKHMLHQVEEARQEMQKWKQEAFDAKFKNQSAEDLIRQQLQNALAAIATSRGEAKAMKTQIGELSAQRDNLLKELAVASTPKHKEVFSDPAPNLNFA